MEQFRRGDLVFDVIDAGPADGPVVVLLHGFPEQNTMWQPVIDRLTAQGYRCLAPLQRGYSPGARPTRRRDYRVYELGQDITTLIDASGAQRVHLVGHDSGAAVAWYFAQQWPDRLLSLTALSVPHPAAFLKALRTSRQALASWYMLLFPAAADTGVVRCSTGAGSSRVPGFLESRSAHAPELAQAEATGDGRARCADRRAQLVPGDALSNPRETGRKVTVPTMYVWSDGDIVLLEKGARLCGDYVVGEYRFELLNGVSHWILDEQPDKLSDLLLDWFSAHPAA